MSNVFKPASPLSEPRTINLREVVRRHQTLNIQEEQKQTKESILTLKKEAEQLYKQAEAKLKQTEADIENMIVQARKQIESEKKQWEQERHQLIEQAKKQGFEAGFEEGESRAHQQYQQIIDETRSIIDLARQEYENKLSDSEMDILDIALKAAEKIIHLKLSDQPELFINIVKSAIEEVRQMPQVNVYVHPSQYDSVMEFKQELQTIVDGNGNLSIYPKHDITENSCLIESPFGKIDASIDTQLRELKSRLFRMFEEARSLENE